MCQLKYLPSDKKLRCLIVWVGGEIPYRLFPDWIGYFTGSETSFTNHEKAMQKASEVFPKFGMEFQVTAEINEYPEELRIKMRSLNKKDVLLLAA